MTTNTNPEARDTLMPKPSHYATADKIIGVEGLTFALASVVGKRGDLAQAREYLRGAIARALAAEFKRGHTIATPTLPPAGDER